MKDEYLLIDDAKEITGLSAKQLLNRSLNEHFTFFFFSSSQWLPVPVGYIEEMYYSRLNVQNSYRAVLHGERDELQSDMLHIRKQDVEKLCLTTGVLLLPDGHEYVPKGLKAAMECWAALFGHGGNDCKNLNKKHIHAWIESNYPPPDIAPTFREEIAKVINPFPEGGAPKTKE